jgi:tripartite-type tricarboxylate transporter receptor subunit TctC
MPVQAQRSVRDAFAGAMMVLAAGVVCGQNYPVKPIRIFTAEAGGGSDSALRMITPGLAARLGQQVIVDNRGIIAADIAAKAPPDGYSLIFIGSTLWVLPLIRDRVAYDAVEDFLPITLATTTANILVVHPVLPSNSVAQLIALARARPGDLNYGTSGVGSVVHVAAELFKAMAGVDIVRVNYYESVSYLCFFAPARTPAAIISRLNREIVAVLNRTDVKEHLLNSGVEPVGNSPEELGALMKFQIAKMSRLFRDANIRDR